jgi:hypothetical protein
MPNNDLLDALKRDSNEATRRFEQARNMFNKRLVVSFFEGESYSKFGIVSLLDDLRKRTVTNLVRLSIRSLEH